MNSLWQAAIIVLAITTIALAVLVLGLMRRAIDVLDRVEGALTANSLETDHVGTGHGWQHTVGETHTLPGAPSLPGDRPYLVTFLEAGCEGCRLLAKDVTRQQRRAATSNLPLVFVLDSADGPLGQLQTKYPCVMDIDHAIADAWHVNASPVTFLVDASGLVLAGDAANTLQQLLALKDRYDQVADTTHSGAQLSIHE